MILETDKSFTGALTKIYAKYLVPLFFEPYAKDIAKRLSSHKISNVLETAAGTGAVTIALDKALAKKVNIIATDLNRAMIDEALNMNFSSRVKLQQADAMQLPFPDKTFDAVVCQFGVMFFPDKAKAFSEAFRVLRPKGVFIFNVWDNIKHNELSDIITLAMEQVFPEDSPRFLPRTPYGYFDKKQITNDLAAAGFITTPEFNTVTERSKTDSAHTAALAICMGTPLRKEIENRNASLLDKAVDTSTRAIANRFGNSKVDAKMQAHVVMVEK